MSLLRTIWWFSVSLKSNTKHFLYWTSLIAQLVKNPPAMQETPVQFLGWEDPLEKEKATHCSILAWRIPWTVHGVIKSQTRLSDFHLCCLTL